MTALSYAIPNIGSKMVQPDGSVSRDWYLFLSAMLQTIGGPTVVTGGGIAPIDVHEQFEEYAVSSTEAQEALRGVEELRNAREAASDTRTNELVRQIDELRNELASSRNDVSQLRSLIEEISARIGEPYSDQIRNRVESLEDRLA